VPAAVELQEGRRAVLTAKATSRAAQASPETGANASAAGDEPAALVVVDSASPRALALSHEQASLLLRICVRHRHALPIYLQSVRREAETLDELIEELRSRV